MEIPQESIVWATPAGQVQLSPSQGRVLQVRVGAEAAFWQPDVFSGGWNAGGDRLWLAPEADWFWNYQDGRAIGYEVPEALDPGAWRQCALDERTCEWEQQAGLKHRRREEVLELRLRRRISLLPDVSRPYFTRALAYATDDAATIVSGIPQQWISLWCVLQVPAGGQAFVGTRGEAEVHDYFEPIPESLSQIGERHVRFELTGRRQFKVGISPEAATGTLLYVRPVADGYLGIVRRFFCQPWRSYCDAPLGSAGGQGDAVQIYSDDGTLGAFGEIECHSPAFPASGRGSQFGSSHVTIVGAVAAEHLAQWLSHWLEKEWN